MNHYQVLKVSHDAPQEVIAAAYRSLAKLFHPDMNQGSRSGTQTLQRINAAYEVLRDPRLRARYDESLRSEGEFDASDERQPDGETHIPQHIYETIDRELRSGTLPETAVAQLADAGYDMDAAAAAVIEVQQRHESQFSVLRFVKANWFWFLLGGFFLIRGCGGGEPETLAEDRDVIKEDWYVSQSFELIDNAEVRVFTNLESGPAIDVFTVDEKSFNIWTTTVKKRQSVSGGWDYYSELSHKGLPGNWTSPWTKLSAGKYVVLFDNTDFGGTSPPMNGVDDNAVVSYRIEVR